MHTRSLFLPAMLVAGLAADLQAQTNATVTITNGNIAYSQSALPTTETPGFAEVLNAGGGDILYQHWWWFRIGGDSREYTFKQDVNATRVVNGSNMVTSWPDVDSRGVISASLTQDVFTTGAQSGYLLETMTVTNTSAAPITLDLFAYTDYDVGGTINLTRGNLSSQVTINTASTTLAGEFAAVGNTGVQVGAYAGVRTLLTNTLVDNLTGWPTGAFGAGDYTGACQWAFASIPPNGSVVVVDYLAAMSCRPNATNYGAGAAGANGVPTITAEYPVQSATILRPISYRLASGAGNALCALLLNIQQANLPLLGLNVLVDPNGASLLFSVTDAGGRASVPLGIPPGAQYCGLNLFAQYFVNDAAGVGGLASHTSGLQLVVGTW